MGEGMGRYEWQREAGTVWRWQWQREVGCRQVKASTCLHCRNPRRHVEAGWNAAVRGGRVGGQWALR